MTDVRFLFDFGSPNAFLAHRAIPAVQQRTGARFAYVPILLGGLFKLTGNQSPAQSMAGIRNKPDYERREMQRFIAHHGIGDFAFNPHFPINTLQLMRGAVAAEAEGADLYARYVATVFDAMWSAKLDMGVPEVAGRALAAAGLPVERLFAVAQSAEVKDRLLANTQAAFDAGAFGSPSFLVGDELFFGKDKLRDVEDELARLAAIRPPR